MSRAQTESKKDIVVQIDNIGCGGEAACQYVLSGQRRQQQNVTRLCVANIVFMPICNETLYSECSINVYLYYTIVKCGLPICLSSHPTPESTR